MSTKSPFEIRADVLGMAKAYMDKQMTINTDFAADTFSHMVKSGKAMQDQWSEFAPKMYSTQDLIDKANEFYSFIVKK